jgi:ubiquinone/menaquinone biosynthesis C-methylase UbiE
MSFAAAAYDRYVVPALFAPWATHLVRTAHIQPGERVLDVACGTGIVSRQVARHVGSQGLVAGLDISADMLSIARLAARREALVIEWFQGQAEHLPFAAGSFDVILCAFGLMFFGDQQAALAEMHRVLRVNGRIGLTVWQGLERHPFYQTLHAVSQRRLGQSSVQAVFSLGDPGTVSSLVTKAGFGQVELEPMAITARFSNPQEFLTWEADVDPEAAPALRGLEAQAQQTLLAAVRQDMQGPLREVMQADEVVLPYHAHVVWASR